MKNKKALKKGSDGKKGRKKTELDRKRMKKKKNKNKKKKQTSEFSKRRKRKRMNELIKKIWMNAEWNISLLEKKYR